MVDSETDAGVADRREPTSCLNCGSTSDEHYASGRDVEYLTSDDLWEYRRCLDCGVVFIATPPRDRLSVIYPSTYYSFSDGRDSFLTRVKRRLDVRFMGRLLGAQPGGELSVLDVGGGVGELATAARSASPRVSRTVVVDIDEACREGCERAGHEFVCSRIEDFEPADRFDLILAYNLIEHIDNPREVLGRLRDHLSATGRLVIKTPNTDSLDARLFRSTPWGGLHVPRHWVLFEAESFRASADAAGLQVQRLEFTQGAPFWTVSIVTWLEDRGWIHRIDHRPMLESRWYGPIAGLAAAFDFARRPFAATSQMIVVMQTADPPDR
ncbi:MAG: class I SAM-dependent methyltransferase [Acidimicrobiales bacterium]